MTGRYHQAGGNPAQPPPTDTVDPVPRQDPPGFPDVPPGNRPQMPPGQVDDASGDASQLGAVPGEHRPARDRQDTDGQGSAVPGVGLVGVVRSTTSRAVQGLTDLAGRARRGVEQLTRRRTD